MANASPYRLYDLGRLQFERLCAELLVQEAGVELEPWDDTVGGLRTSLAPAGLAVPPDGPSLPGPTLVAAIAWGSADPRVEASARFEALRVLLTTPTADGATPASLLALTDVHTPQEALAAPFVGTTLAILGPDELGAILDRSPELRRRLPFVLGVRDVAGLVPDEVERRSTVDVDACLRLARVFPPTRALRAGTSSTTQPRVHGVWRFTAELTTSPSPRPGVGRS